MKIGGGMLEFDGFGEGAGHGVWEGESFGVGLGNEVDVDVLLGEGNVELLRGEDFLFGVGFFQWDGGVFSEEGEAEHFVKLLAVVGFEVVGAGVGVDVGSEVFFPAQEFELGFCGSFEWGESMGSGETAFVLGVLGEKKCPVG